MTFCLGPVCRDLTPVRGPRSLYCSACSREVRRQKLATYHRTWISKPGKRALRRATNRAYMAARRAA